MERLTAGAVAKLAGINVETLRFYERRGLLPKPPRTAANYRIYSEEDVRRIRFVKQAQQLGFSLTEIEELLSLRAQPAASSASVCDRARSKIQDIDERILSLQRMRDTLTELVEQCSGQGPVSTCVILKGIEEGECSKKGDDEC